MDIIVYFILSVIIFLSLHMAAGIFEMRDHLIKKNAQFDKIIDDIKSQKGMNS